MSYKCVVFAVQEEFLSNIVNFSNVGLMLGQRRRCWTNSKTVFCGCLVRVVSIVLKSSYSYSAECNQHVSLLYIAPAVTVQTSREEG